MTRELTFPEDRLENVRAALPEAILAFPDLYASDRSVLALVTDAAGLQDEALKAIEALPPDRNRASGLLGFAAHYIKIGNKDAARALLEKVQLEDLESEDVTQGRDPLHNYTLLKIRIALASNLLRLGQRDEAQALGMELQAVPAREVERGISHHDRSWMYSRLVAAYIDVKDLDAAQDLAVSLPGASVRIDQLLQVGIACAQAEDTTRAHAIAGVVAKMAKNMSASKCLDIYARNAVLYHLSGDSENARASLNEARGVLTTSKDLQDLEQSWGFCKIAGIEAMVLDNNQGLEGTVALAKSLLGPGKPHEGRDALEELAAFQIIRENPEGAAETLRLAVEAQQVFPFVQSEVLCQVLGAGTYKLPNVEITMPGTYLDEVTSSGRPIDVWGKELEGLAYLIGIVSHLRNLNVPASKLLKFALLIPDRDYHEKSVSISYAASLAARQGDLVTAKGCWAALKLIEVVPTARCDRDFYHKHRASVAVAAQNYGEALEIAKTKLEENPFFRAEIARRVLAGIAQEMGLTGTLSASKI